MALLLPATQDIDATVVEELEFLGGTVSAGSTMDNAYSFGHFCR